MLLKKIIDIHTHVGDLLYGQPLTEPYDWPVRTLADINELSGFRFHKPLPGLKTLMSYLELQHIHQRNNCATMDNVRRYSQPFGVTHSVLLPIEPVCTTESTLEEAINGCTPDHSVYSFASVHPEDPDKIPRLHKLMEAGCIGLKLHPILQNTPATDEGYFEILEEFKQYGKPVLIHAGVTRYFTPDFTRYQYSDPDNYDKMLSSFPDIGFIMGHMGMNQRSGVFALAEKYENVFADASFQSAKNIRVGFSKMGEDRVMFGTDCPFSLPKYTVNVGKKACKNNLPLMEKFFYKNAESLIGELDMPQTCKVSEKRKNNQGKIRIDR